MNTPINWTESEYRNFNLIPQVAAHSYHELPLFKKEALIKLLDDYPRRWLQAFTMGEDPCRNDEWKCVDISAESTGEELWRAAETGRIWYNITHIEEYNDAYRDLIDGMYEHLSSHCQHMSDMRANYSTLLISSPGAQVYYHLDAEPNMLWHIRGQKKIWVYPAMDTHFVSQEFIEDIYAGAIGENVPFKPEFDEHSQQFLLSPGDVASWPHNGPHRIENVDMNVSLATSYLTHSTYKREYTQLANRFLLRNNGVKNRSMKEEGPVAAMKRFSFRAINKIKPFPRSARNNTYITDLQVDPASHNSLKKLDAERPASFSSLVENVSKSA